MELAGAKVGDLMLFGAGDNNIVFASLANVRLALGKELDLIDEIINRINQPQMSGIFKPCRINIPRYLRGLS